MCSLCVVKMLYLLCNCRFETSEFSPELLMQQDTASDNCHNVDLSSTSFSHHREIIHVDRYMLIREQLYKHHHALGIHILLSQSTQENQVGSSEYNRLQQSSTKTPVMCNMLHLPQTFNHWHWLSHKGFPKTDSDFWIVALSCPKLKFQLNLMTCDWFDEMTRFHKTPCQSWHVGLQVSVLHFQF